MSIVESHLSVWEALAGRAPGQPIGPSDTDVWSAVVDRINPARAKPERPRLSDDEVAFVNEIVIHRDAQAPEPVDQ